MKRQISLVLAMLLLALSGCSPSGAPENTDTTPVADDTTAPIADGESRSGVPAGTDLKDETINIWYSSTNGSTASYTALDGDAQGDTLDSTIHATVSSIEEDLNVNLNFVDTGTAPGSTGAEMQKLIMADDTSYDLFNFVQYTGAHFIADGLYYNVKDSEYLSFDEPWWDMEYMKEMTVGKEKIYLLVGDAALDRTRFSSCLFFNTAMLTDMGTNPDSVYDLVLDGKWTLEQLDKLSADAWRDLNNSGSIDDGDVFGYLSNTTNHIDALTFSEDFRMTTRTDDDIPELSMMNEKNSDIADRIYRFFYESEGKLAIYESSTYFTNIFTSGNSLFLAGNFYNADALRDMKQSYGFLPMPKADEAQANYITVIHNSMRDYALPANCQKPDAVCAVLEELAFRSHRDILPVYVENTLKIKYTRDEKSAQMIDIILDNTYCDFAYIYNTYTGLLPEIPRYMIKEQNNAFASLFEAKRSAAEAAIEELVDSFLASTN